MYCSYKWHTCWENHLCIKSVQPAPERTSNFGWTEGCEQNKKQIWQTRRSKYTKNLKLLLYINLENMSQNSVFWCHEGILVKQAEARYYTNSCTMLDSLTKAVLQSSHQILFSKIWKVPEAAKHWLKELSGDTIFLHEKVKYTSSCFIYKKQKLEKWKFCWSISPNYCHSS